MTAMSQPLIITIRGRAPRLHPDSWVAPNASIIGQVSLAAHASVWYSATIEVTPPAEGATTTVDAAVGDTVVVSLAANATTGYEWTFTGGDTFTIEKSDYVPDPNPDELVGKGGTQVAQKFKPEYLRLALAAIVLLIAARMFFGLFVRPEEIYTVVPL